MASFRSLFSHWRKIRDRDQPHPHVVHLYFLCHDGLPHYYLYGPGFLDEHEKVYEGSQTKSLVLFITGIPPDQITSLGFFLSTIFTLKYVR